MQEPEFLGVLHRVAQLKPSLSDFYSVEFAAFVDDDGADWGRERLTGDCAHWFAGQAIRDSA